MKSELGYLPTEPVFGAPEDVLFRLVKDGLVVCLLCAQQVLWAVAVIAWGLPSFRVIRRKNSPR